VPYLGVTEVAVGITPGFSTGVLFAVADELGVGLRPRFQLLQAGPMRVALAIPLVYYPPSWKRKGDDWLYTDPSLRLDFELPRGAHVYAGGGIVLAACTGNIGAVLKGEEPHDDGDHGMVGGIWPTVHVGAAMPVTPSLNLIFDGATVLGGMTPRPEYARRIGISVYAEVGIVKTF
jgi:hypothetical protein